MNLQPAIDYLRDLSPVRETRVGVALDDVATALAMCIVEKQPKTHYKDFADTPQAKEVCDPGGPYKAIGLGNVQSGHQTLRNTWAVWGFAQEMYRKHGDSAERRCRYIAAILNLAYAEGLAPGVSLGQRSLRIVVAAEAWAADWGSTIPAHPLQRALWEACQ